MSAESKTDLSFVLSLFFSLGAGFITWFTRPMVRQIENKHAGWALLTNNVIGILGMIAPLVWVFKCLAGLSELKRIVAAVLSCATIFGFGVFLAMALTDHQSLKQLKRNISTTLVLTDRPA